MSDSTADKGPQRTTTVPMQADQMGMCAGKLVQSFGGDTGLMRCMWDAVNGSLQLHLSTRFGCTLAAAPPPPPQVPSTAAFHKYCTVR